MCIAPDSTSTMYASGFCIAYMTLNNIFQILQSQGKYQNQPPFPFVLGSEFSGKVSENSPLPKGCPFKHGDRVFGYAQGAYADRVAADFKYLLPLPNKMSYDNGAGLSCRISMPHSILTKLQDYM